MSIRRRRLLAAGGGGLVAALAGCTGDRGADATETVQVGPDGDLRFEPAELSVDVGATVEWEWDSDTHTVTPETVPDGADWEGTGTGIFDEGHSHSHTFDVEGRYDYYCEPHRSSGMTGTLLVGDAAADGSDGAGGSDGDDDAY